MRLFLRVTQETCPQLTSEHGGATGRYCCDERQIHDLSTKVSAEMLRSACKHMGVLCLNRAERHSQALLASPT
jgi:hypothetical protein